MLKCPTVQQNYTCCQAGTKTILLSEDNVCFLDQGNWLSRLLRDANFLYTQNGD